MRAVLNAQEMKNLDQKTIEMGIPSLVLMERAALSVADEIMFRRLPMQKVLVVCGTGNNAGDGIAVARILYLRGIAVDVFIAGERIKFSDQMRQQVIAAENFGLHFINSADYQKYTLIIDAIFGIGLKRDVTGFYAKVIKEINLCDAFKVSVDIPSGIHTDDGRVMGTAVKADMTVTFAALKTGLCLYPGAAYAGEVLVKDIGIPVPVFGSDEACSVYACEDQDLKIRPDRFPAGNKSTFGKLLIIAGSEKMCGAAYLSAKAAMHTGAGMVKLYTHSLNRSPVFSRLPELLITTYDEEGWDAEPLIKDMEWADFVLIGPGLDTGVLSTKILNTFLDNCRKPALMDADALNMISVRKEVLKDLPYPIVITPHIGEMARLTGYSSAEIKAAPFRIAEEFASEYGVTCMLKDARTVIAEPDHSKYINLSGNSTLSKAGSGDILAGMTASFCMQYPYLHIPPFVLSAYLHGKSGEKAGEKYSQAGARPEHVLEAILDVQ